MSTVSFSIFPNDNFMTCAFTSMEKNNATLDILLDPLHEITISFIMFSLAQARLWLIIQRESHRLIP